MRGFRCPGCAQMVCDGHGFMRALCDGVYRLGRPTSDPRILPTPRLAGDNLTRMLVAA